MASSPPVTLKRLADATGVHPSTVSRALNEKTRHLVASDVAERILAAAQTLGYRPNRLAASLRTGQSRLIGVILPDIANPVFAPILGGITEVLSEQGYSPVVADAGNDRSRQTSFVDDLINHQVDGLILATVSREDGVVSHCLQRGVSVVLVNRSEQRGRVSAVVSDDAHGIRLAVDHVVELGHRVIGHVSGPRHLSTGDLRQSGYIGAIRQHGLEPHIEEAERYAREAGIDPALRLLRSVPGLSAIVAANDLLALGVFDAIQSLGLSCPGDISVVGHNDMPLVDLVSPPLTTVRISHRDMGCEAARLLLEEITTGVEPRRRLVLPSELVVRASTSVPGRREG
ncbi:LacI family DNA-binding transcriptional regulator [Azorhizobium doebereinerae]|uniref:LacI family DNA-binding transcriptional regulator n=1 Tax=Azorhizobium doebereinerae TaxID=281091 RepID=UPI00048F2E49|nr:LacI family DNA-binding transcriptional regulator [Azorhizobium doebereinerae]